MWGLGTFPFESKSILILLYGDQTAGVGGPPEYRPRGLVCTLLCDPRLQLEDAEEQTWGEDFISQGHVGHLGRYFKAQYPEWRQHLPFPTLKNKTLLWSNFSCTLKSRERCRHFPCAPCPYTCVVSPVSEITHRNATFIFNRGWNYADAS